MATREGLQAPPPRRALGPRMRLEKRAGRGAVCVREEETEMGGAGAHGVLPCPAPATILAVGGGLGLVAGRSGPEPPALPSRVVEAALSRRCLCVSAQRFMENCLAAAALNGVDRRALQRSARLGREVLERAKRRAVDWPSQERPRGGSGALPQAATPAACPLHLVQEEVRAQCGGPACCDRSASLNREVS